MNVRTRGVGRRSWRGIISLILGLAVTGCGSTAPLFVHKAPAPKTLQEGANVSTAVVYVRPWSEIADSLSPKFANTPDGALGNVLTSQNFSDFRLLRSLGISAQAGVRLDPVSTVTDEAVRKVTTRTTGDVTETTGDATDRTVTTKKVNDNTPPDVGELPAARSGSATALADQIGATRTPATEPFFRYSAATALYQEIGLLNDAVGGIPGFEGKKPYIIRLRVGLVPFRRDLPWDVYAHLMLGIDDSEVHDPLIVLPILSSEAYEGTMDASALQQINELRLGIQALAANAKVSGGISRLNDNLTQFLTRTYSPALQVTGIGGQTIDVKFTASRDKTGYALASRNFYVTLVAYLDEPPLNGKVKKYRLYTKYEARDSERGHLVTSDNTAFFAATDLIASNAGITVPEGCDRGVIVYYYVEFVKIYGAVQAGSKLLEQYKDTQCVSADTVTALSKSSVLLDAVAARQLLETSSFPFEIQPKRASLLPGAVPFVQDGAESLVIDIPYRGPDQFPLDKISASLTDSSGSLRLDPKLVSLRAAGAQRLIHLEFPALSAFKSGAVPGGKGKKVPAADPRAKPEAWTVAANVDEGAASLVYSASLAAGYIATVPKPAVPEFTFTSPVRAARLGADGLLSFSVFVKLPDAGKVKLTARDAEIFEGGSAVTELPVASSGTRTITLRNAMQGQSVTLTATAVLDADAKAKAENSISILVQPPLTVPK